MTTKEQLIEEMGVHYENTQQMSPLVARVFAHLILTGKGGLSFEAILEATKASKGTISACINFLLQTGRIEYFTIPGDRKRYFRKSRTHLMQRLKNNMENLNAELAYFRKIEAYNKVNNQELYQENLCFSKIYAEYLENYSKLVEKMLEKFDQTHTKNT